MGKGQFGESQKINILMIIILCVILSTIANIFITRIILSPPKIGYIDAAKLFIGFSESAKAEREIKSEDAKWKIDMKSLKDTINAKVEVMSKEYDKASAARKKELQDMLAAANQNANNFAHANKKRIEEIRQEKMRGAIQKVNFYVAEYGKEHNYSMIFSTSAAGSIVYGNQEKLDLTNEIIKGLNERYK